MKHIYIIGAGNVATHLSAALQQKGYFIDGVYSRSEASAASLARHLDCPAVTSIDDISRLSDIYLFAVSDKALTDLVPKVARRHPEALFIHTAGSVSIDIFKGFAHSYGVAYPLQTFTKERQIDIAEIPFFIEGSSDEATNAIRKLCLTIGKSATIARSDERKRLHLAAVFACNFTNHCFALAQNQIAQAGLSFDVLLPLIKETIAKLDTLSPIQAQTGPAVRHDTAVINSHIAMLDSAEEKEIYRLLSENIFRISKK